VSISYFIQQAGEYGIGYTLGALLRAKMRLTIREFPQVLALVRDKRGLEVGGPSSSFRPGGILPIYDSVGSLDNCTFSANTVWAKHGVEYRFSAQRPPGQHFVSEGAELSGLANESYDFIISSHMIEHTANPLGALAAWKRVLRPGGTLVLLVPDKERTFDNKRATTTMEHLLADDRANTREDDRTHIEEMLRDHNMRRTPDWTRERLQALVEDNLQFRGLHHHVFDLPLVRSMLEHTGLEIVITRRSLPNHLVGVARKA
jgi:SAM-dependent methyltransferase